MFFLKFDPYLPSLREHFYGFMFPNLEGQFPMGLGS